MVVDGAAVDRRGEGAIGARNGGEEGHERGRTDQRWIVRIVWERRKTVQRESGWGKRGRWWASGWGRNLGG